MRQVQNRTIQIYYQYGGNLAVTVLKIKAYTSLKNKSKSEFLQKSLYPILPKDLGIKAY